MQKKSFNLDLDLLGINQNTKNIYTTPSFQDEELEKKFSSWLWDEQKIIRPCLDLIYIGYLCIKIIIPNFHSELNFLLNLICLLIYFFISVFKLFFVKKFYVSDILDKIASALLLSVLGFCNALSFHESSEICIERNRSCYFFIIISMFEIIFSKRFNLLFDLYVILINLIVFLYCYLISNNNQKELRCIEIISSFIILIVCFFCKVIRYLSIRAHYLKKFKVKKYFNYFYDLNNNFNGYHISHRNNEIKFVNENFVNYLKESFSCNKNFNSEDLNKELLQSRENSINDNNAKTNLNMINDYKNENKQIINPNKEIEKFKNLKNENFKCNHEITNKLKTNELEAKTNSKENPKSKNSCTQANEFLESLKPYKLELPMYDCFSTDKSQEFQTTKENTNSNSENNSLSNWNLLSMLRKIQYLKNPDLNSKEKSFTLLGEFKHIQQKKYYKVYYRKLHDQNDLEDFLIYDISAIKEAKEIETIFKSKFFPKIAHEFKTPLTIIIGFIDRMKDENKKFLRHLEANNKQNINEDPSCESFDYNSDLNFQEGESSENSSQNNNYNCSSSENRKYNNNYKTNKCKYFENFENKKLGLISENFEKILEEARNLCEYCIFLIRDITEYSNMNKDDLKTKNSKNNFLINPKNKQNLAEINNSHNSKNLIIENINIIEIAEFCRKISMTLLNSKNKQNINSILDIDPVLNEKKITSDPLRVKQILLNFLSNSIKFTRSGFIKIKICVVCGASQKEKIKISIIDTGIGIKPLDLKIIFTDEVMLDPTKGYNEFGSGLGLSITKSIANNLGHKIEVKSEYGKGSEFSLILDCEQDEKKEAKRISTMKSEEEKEDDSINFKVKNDENGAYYGRIIEKDSSKNSRNDFDLLVTNYDKNTEIRDFDSMSYFIKEEQRENLNSENSFDCRKLINKNKQYLQENDNCENDYIHYLKEPIDLEKFLKNKNLNKKFCEFDKDQELNKTQNSYILQLQEDKKNNTVKSKTIKKLSDLEKNAEASNSEDRESIKFCNRSNNQEFNLSHSKKKQSKNQLTEDFQNPHDEIKLKIKNNKSKFGRKNNCGESSPKQILNNNNDKNSEINNFFLNETGNIIKTNSKYPKDLNFNNLSENSNKTSDIEYKSIILIADDHAELRLALKRLISKILQARKLENKFSVLEATDGSEILYLLVKDQSNHNKIKCIITDENMEYLNGSQVIRIIRKLENEKKILYVPIASYTAFEDKQTIDSIISSGSDYILHKPCNHEKLLDFMEKFDLLKLET